MVCGLAGVINGYLDGIAQDYSNLELLQALR